MTYPKRVLVALFLSYSLSLYLQFFPYILLLVATLIYIPALFWRFTAVPSLSSDLSFIMEELDRCYNRAIRLAKSLTTKQDKDVAEDPHRWSELNIFKIAAMASWSFELVRYTMFDCHRVLLKLILIAIINTSLLCTKNKSLDSFWIFKHSKKLVCFKINSTPDWDSVNLYQKKSLKNVSYEAAFTLKNKGASRCHRRTFLSKWFHKEPLTSEEPFFFT